MEEVELKALQGSVDGAEDVGAKEDIASMVVEDSKGGMDIDAAGVVENPHESSP